MAPLLVLNGNKIIEASLLRHAGECRTSPTPEEEATLLGDIKPNIKHKIKQEIKCKIEPPQILEQLEICEQVQPAEWTPTSTAFLQSSSSQPSNIPSQKAKKLEERATGAYTISAYQWVWAYLEENYRVPKWWREFWSLPKHPCDPAIQKLACQQAVPLWIPATQLKEDGLWIASSCLEVLGRRKYLPPKDFQGSHDYQEVRREETVALALALQSCAMWSGMPPGMLCGVVQELHQCLALLIEEDGLLNVEMLDAAEKDPVAPVPASAPASPTPDPEEEEQVIQIPEESFASEPEEDAHSEGGLDLVWGRYPAIPLGIACL